MLAKNPVIYSDYPDPDVIRVGDSIMVVTTHTGFSDLQDILA